MRKNLEPCSSTECQFFTTYTESPEGTGMMAADRRHNHDLHVCILCDRFKKFDLWTPREKGDEGL
jgi:hypothetical protein